MKITAFYYLDYPDAGPADPDNAATMMYVERGDEGDSINSFQDTLCFQVYTFGYVQENFIKQGKPVIGRSLLLVPTLDNTQMGAFLDAHADDLAEWGEHR